MTVLVANPPHRAMNEGMTIMKTEVGVVTAHPIVYAYKLVRRVFNTWRFARKMGYPCNKWHGVYEQGTEIILADMGCLPGSDARAMVLMNANGANLKIATEALEQLSCFGNGDRPGNSLGNAIAQKALDDMKP